MHDVRTISAITNYYNLHSTVMVTKTKPHKTNKYASLPGTTRIQFLGSISCVVDYIWFIQNCMLRGKTVIIKATFSSLHPYTHFKKKPCELSLINQHMVKPIDSGIFSCALQGMILFIPTIHAKHTFTCTHIDYIGLVLQLANKHRLLRCIIWLYYHPQYHKTHEAYRIYPNGKKLKDIHDVIGEHQNRM